MSEPNYRMIQTMGMVSSIGLLIFVATAIGMGFGYWLDSKLGTKPWLAFVFTLLGLAAGLYEAVVLLLKIIHDSNDE